MGIIALKAHPVVNDADDRGIPAEFLSFMAPRAQNKYYLDQQFQLYFIQRLQSIKILKFI